MVLIDSRSMKDGCTYVEPTLWIIRTHGLYQVFNYISILDASTATDFREGKVFKDFDIIILPFVQWFFRHNPILDAALITNWHTGKTLNISVFEDQVIYFSLIRYPS